MSYKLNTTQKKGAAPKAAPPAPQSPPPASRTYPAHRSVGHHAS